MGAKGFARFTGMVVLGVLLAFATQAAAQIDTASIVGTVTDQSGGVLPGVTVTATQDATGVVSSTVTNGQGQYVFSGVKVGTYTVVAELAGFKKAERTGVRISVQDRAAVDFSLTVGEVSEVVSVSGKSEILQTQSADIGNVVDEKQVQSLPLLGRRYSELAFLTPGVVVAPAGITSRGEDTFFNANGNYATWNNYT
ncbi:MAG: carboxypeptidase regulatory-like domain-containing protein, partial [Acidobacteria bacterium]|nr:carboxypeptidase regulatory-like domain-containing protein [Acidobacteriota bacterium]